MLRDGIAKREKELPYYTIGKLLKIAAESKDIISLGPGEPDFVTPSRILTATKRYLDRGFTHYSPPGGRAELKEAIIKKLKRENKISAKPENIIVTTGSTEAILLTLMCIIDPGEAVMITDPAYFNYKATIEILNGIPIMVPLLEEENFELNRDKLEEFIIPEKTKAIIINSPNNPIGTVMKKKELEEIADFAIEHDLLVISDEAYEKFIYDGEKHVSIGSLNGMENNTMSVFTLSKTYAMTGFRLGFAVGRSDIINAMTKIHLFTSICAPTISQMAALNALTGSQKCVERMIKEYDKRRKFIMKRLEEIERFYCVKPKGAFYAFPNIEDFGMKSLEFAEWLLKNAKVAVVPGTEFGKYGEGFIRLSYATSLDKIKIAMDRIERSIKKLG